MKLKYIWLLLILIGFTACNTEEDVTPDGQMMMALPELSTEGLDFSNYVSIGASFTAGFTDNALFIAGQENSFPNQLAQQFANATGGDFSQPLMSDNVGGFVFGGNPLPDGSFGPRLFFNGAGPATLPATPTTEATTVLSGPFNNLGVPGAKSFHFTFDGYGTLNPYFGRMASAPTTSVLADALAQAPTFFTLSEVGGNDVLGYALSGGTGVDQTGNINPATYGVNDITDPNVFAQVFSGMVGALTQGGAKGVVTTVPDITSLSHFTTVPYNPLDPSNPDFGPQIPVLNATFAQLNQAFAFLGMPERSVVFSEDEPSPIVILDESLPNIAAQLNAVLQGGGADPLTAGLLSAQFAQSRQATAEDLLVLPSSSVIATLNQPYFDGLVAAGVPPATAGQLAINGITFPMEDQWVLTPEEQMSIATATMAYNSTIEAVAGANPNVAVADLRAVLEQAATTGYPFDDYTMTTDLVFGGLVSLDGVHLTARGYGLMAREFLVAIDETFGSNFIDAGFAPEAGLLPTNYSATLQ